MTRFRSSANGFLSLCGTMIAAPATATDSSPYVPAAKAAFGSFTILYWGLFAVALYWTISTTKGIRRITWVLGVTLGFGYLPVQSYLQLLPWHRAQIYFADKCANVAGIEIFKTVSGVEGLLLLKERAVPSQSEWQDRLWPSAAFVNEHGGDSYINSFLGDEHASGKMDGTLGVITPRYRGYINTDRRPTGRPGYRFVDVIDEKDGKRYRYTGSEKVVGRKDTSAPGVQMALQKDPNYDLNVYRWTLEKAPGPDPAPRYGVTYDEYVIPEERALWIASGKVTVIDLETKEVLAKMTQYKHSWGGVSPWLRGPVCPGFGGTSDGYTRKFVDQVLIPAAR